ncbi:fungal-specific transcription factor domain-containing protein [Aspergillus oleicola]
MKAVRRSKTRKAQCPFCPKTFTRTEHLQRHLGSHGVGKAVTCPECGKDFMRKDVLKRHLDKCQYKPKSADSVEANKATNTSLDELQSPPAYQSHSTDISPYYNTSSTGHTLISQTFSCPTTNPPLPGQTDSTVECDDARLALSTAPETIWSNINFDNIQFLFDNTILDKDDALQLQDVSAGPAPSGFGVPCLNVDPADTFNFLAKISSKETASLKTRYGSALYEQEWAVPDTSSSDTGPSNSQSIGMPGLCGDLPLILTQQSNSIISLIKEVSQKSPITPPWTPQLEKSCALFFSPQYITRFIALYWVAWHPHYPVLHKPTFSISSTPTHLLAAMCLIGAFFSPNENDKVNAKLWLNPVEEMVFSSRYFGDLMLLDGATVDVRDVVQLLQAAYCVSTAQISEGSKISRRRMRRVRFGMVVSLARDLNLFNITHGGLDRLRGSDFCWHSFVATEECIRTMLFIYANDTGFAIFSNYPPRMRIQEMSLNMACPETCFNVSSAQECFAAIKTWTSHPPWRRRMTLREMVEVILCTESSPEIQEYLSHLGILNLWIICSALIAEAFTLNTLIRTTTTNLTPVRRALHTWKVSWNQRYALADNFGLPKEEDQILDRPQDTWRRVGFFQNASEYWLLLHILIQRIEEQQKARHEMISGQSSAIVNGIDESNWIGPYMPSNCDSPTMADLKSLILGHHQRFQAYS